MVDEMLAGLLERVRAWPVEDQEKLASLVDEIEAERAMPYELSPEEEAAVQEGLNQANRGEFVSAARLAEIWKRLGLA